MLRVRTSKTESLPFKLILEDGEIFEGFSFGHFSKEPVIGEVVFNTGMVGYTEAMTDPSYSGQILCFTYPLIGNYGVPDYATDQVGILRNFESEKIQVSGLIANQVSEQPSHFESRKSLGSWMGSESIPGIFGIDTRELTIHLRSKGVMMGALALSTYEGKSALAAAESYSSVDYCRVVATKSPRTFGKNSQGSLAILDCGVKLNIVRSLVQRGFEVTLYPYDTKYEQIVSNRPRGIILSNGPGDPLICKPAIGIAAQAINDNLPLLGICLGTQIVALALGAKTFKLKYGHRGQNKPCIDLKTGKCMVTSQNHGYSVDEKSLEGTDLEPWFLNADDRTIEGVIHKSKPCIAVQFHPEGSPGPLDPSYVFDVFTEKVRKES